MGSGSLRRYLPRVALALAGFGLAAAASELSLRMGDLPPPQPSGWSGCGRTAVHCNELGTRGRSYASARSARRVLLLGDSQIESWVSAPAEMPERVLEKALAYRGVRDVDVRSLGADGWGQDQQLLALERYFAEQRADVVLLWFTEGNDLADNVFSVGGENHSPKPTFWIERSQLRGPTEAWLSPAQQQPVWRVPALLTRALGGPSSAWRGVAPSRRAWHASRLPAPRAPRACRADDGPEAGWARELAEEPEDLAALRIEHTDLAFNFAPSSERMKRAAALTNQLIARIASTAAQHGARFFVFRELRPHQTRPLSGPSVQRVGDECWDVDRAERRALMRSALAGQPVWEQPLRVENYRVSPTDGHLNPRALVDVLSFVADRVVADELL
jgi:hypothetical protein